MLFHSFKRARESEEQHTEMSTLLISTITHRSHRLCKWSFQGSVWSRMVSSSSLNMQRGPPPASVSSQWSLHQLLHLSPPDFQYGSNSLDGRTLPSIFQWQRWNNSGLMAFWTTVMKDSEPPTAGCISAAGSLQRSGDRPVASSEAASNGLDL